MIVLSLPQFSYEPQKPAVSRRFSKEITNSRPQSPAGKPLMPQILPIWQLSYGKSAESLLPKIVSLILKKD